MCSRSLASRTIGLTSCTGCQSLQYSSEGGAGACATGVDGVVLKAVTQGAARAAVEGTAGAATGSAAGDMTEARGEVAIPAGAAPRSAAGARGALLAGAKIVTGMPRDGTAAGAGGRPTAEAAQAEATGVAARTAALAATLVL